MSWPVVNFGDVVSFIGGSQPPKSTFLYERQKGYVRLLQIRDYKSDKNLTFIPEDSTKKFCNKDDVMIGRYGPPVFQILKGLEGAYNVALMKAKPSVKVDPDYLYYFLKQDKLFRLIDGLSQRTAGQSGIDMDALKGYPMLLPPINEQKRIAAILDKADAIRRKRQQAIQLADDFLRSVFLDMFGTYFTTDGYSKARKKKIKELVDYIDYRGRTPTKSENGVPLITAKNVKKGFISTEPREFIPEENYFDWMTRGLPKLDDVLFTTEAPLGNVAMLGKYEKVVVGQRLIALRSKGDMTQHFLMFALLDPFIQQLIYSRSSGSTVKGIRTKELYEIELPIPELNKQEQFSDIYKKYLNKKVKSDEGFCKHSLLFNSLSQKAFAGQL